jgi:hypothetical protein
LTFVLTHDLPCSIAPLRGGDGLRLLADQGGNHGLPLLDAAFAHGDEEAIGKELTDQRRLVANLTSSYARLSARLQAARDL